LAPAGDLSWQIAVRKRGADFALSLYCWRCVSAELGRFGQVKVERDEKPEAGKVRLFLLRRDAGNVRTAATIYLNGVQSFSALWMDASGERLGNAIWRIVTRHCQLT